MAFVLPSFVAVLLGIGLWSGMYAGIPRYAGLRDLSRLAIVMVLASLCLLIASEVSRILTGLRPLPISVSLMALVFTFVGLGAARFAKRMALDLRAGSSGPDVERVLVVGAGDAGEHVTRDMLRTRSRFVPVGFLDDDPGKLGRRIHGLSVMGSTSDVAEAVAATKADHVLVAMPGASSRKVQEVLKRVALPGLGVKVLPSLGELMGEAVSSSDIRDVDISDLIARSLVTVDLTQIASTFDGMAVVITGAAGSIGSQLARQALKFSPSALILLDNDENDLYGTFLELKAMPGAEVIDLRMMVVDIRDARGVARVFGEIKPDLVFHAAAYKHVPVMELHPSEAVITNVTGTRNVATAASRFHAKRFVLVSTDKAVNPTSVMGATKRLSEMVMASVARESATVFSAVRFGNVVASRGSVVPTFQRQIREGGPVTVTHPEATRYFMTIEEAVALIWQAAALAEGGEIFALEMGEPVKIMDLALRMRSLLGNGDPDRIKIVVTGLRPGEKIHEDLFRQNETLDPLRPGILKAGASSYHDLDQSILALERLAAEHPDPTQVSAMLLAITSGNQLSPVAEKH